MTTVDHGDACVIQVSGEIDLDVAGALRTAVQAACGHGRIVLDLSDVTFMDSTGLSVIVLARNLVDHRDGTWVRVANPMPNVRRVIEITGVHRVAPIYDSVDEALVG